LRPWVKVRATMTTPPPRTVAAFAELGLGLVAIPKDMGGLALGPLAATLVAECLAAGDVNIAFSLPQPGAFAEALVRLGSPVQRARWGHAFCVEPERTWGTLIQGDHGDVRACLASDGNWYLRGQVAAAAHAVRADRIIVIAQEVTSHTAGTNTGGKVAVVLPLPHPGVIIGEPQLPMGLPLSAPAAVTFADAVVEPDNVLAHGNLTDALALMTANLDLRIASMALGTARAASAYVLGFAEARRQAGSPLAHFQSMGFLLVDMHLACETALKRLREAASAAQTSALGVHFHKPTPVVDLNDLISGITAARAEAEEVAFFVTDSAMQILDDGQEQALEHPIAAWHHDVQGLAQAYRRPQGG
jgi:alkylation response protein AidB-like acyl-CoA dehydrogenase